ncbi:bifunctional DNA primase/polymerase [Streptomyces roseoverticillatus]|uniref:bifunctional DNA primase/polymerase n=1 Tax=Streptomyces roseoverticillatus TaxID=66429 RepID=UPI003404F51B
MPAELRFSASDSASGPPPPSVAGFQSLKTALHCAARGWPVHPLAPGRKTPAANCEACRQAGHTATGCSCLPAGRWCHGFHAATLDTARIEAWWGSRPSLGVGVACGPARLVVIDVDAHSSQRPARDRILPGIPIGDHVNLTGLASGFHTLAVLAALRQQPSPAADTGTLRVRTPSGGLHIWYRTDPHRRWLCSAGSSTGRALAWQVDVRAHGGYIVAPGTTTHAGTYTALPGATEPAPLPAWLAHELQRTGHLHVPAAVPAPRPVPPRAKQAVIAAGGDDTRVQRTLNAVLASVSDCGRASEGAGFSSTLNRAAYTLGGLVAAGLVDHNDADRLLRDVAAAARPGQERRAEQIIRSGLAAGTQRPLDLGRRA